MTAESENGYPHVPAAARTVHIGGLTRSQLRQSLQNAGISLNAYAEELFADERFTTSDQPHTVETVELTVGELGFMDGAAAGEIFKRASALGLAACPLELAPHLRLQYTDQPEGSAERSVQHEAPHASITVASEPLSECDDFPKGFYLRNIDGVLWLRGYRADAVHVWNAWDRFVFARQTDWQGNCHES
ncbi:helicase [Saccharibacillus qingshengii]|uniref:helicase n=1 Tax=Saccharibacillus qingshengii TaxID=1763540 RepID=UPI0015569993|nr:helicase [Saccharibacillus qingshengii]